MKKNYWVFAVQAFLMLLFLGLAVAYPWTTIRSVAVIFALVLILQGMFSFVNGLVNFGVYQNAVWSILYGLISITIGFGIVTVPSWTVITLTYILAGWIFLSGLLDIIDGLFIRSEAPTELYLILSGVISILFSLLLIAFPAGSAIAFMWFVGIYILIWLVFSWSQEERLKRAKREE